MDARRARRVEGVPDGAAPRFSETRVVRETRATYLDRGPSARGSEYGTPSSMTSAPASSRIASAFSVASRLGSPALMKGTNAHWLRLFRAAKVSPMDAVAVAVSAARAHRRGARGAARRDGRARCELDAREGGGGEGGGGHRGSSEDDRRGLRSRGGTRTTGACVGGRHLRCRAGVRTLVLPSAAVSASAARRLTRFRLPPPLDESRLDKSKIVMIVIAAPV